MAEEPEQIDLSPYQYACNNPTNTTDPDGRCPACVGFVIGAAVELTTQVVTNYVNGKSLTNIDVTDVLVAGGVGAITGGLSVVGKFAQVGVAAASNVTEGFVKSKTGSQKGEYGLKEATFDAVTGGLIEAGGAVIKKIVRSTPENKATIKSFAEMERRANNAAEGSRRANKVTRNEQRAQNARMNMNQVGNSQTKVAQGVIQSTSNSANSLLQAKLVHAPSYHPRLPSLSVLAPYKTARADATYSIIKTRKQ